MMLEKLLSAIFQFRDFKYRYDDDSIDRLSRQYTPALLVLFTIVISVKQYVGAPIDCWCPAQFTQTHIDYANAICWVNNTYYVPFEESMPMVDQPRRTIAYYQWVPFILLLQSIFFFSPCLIWRFFGRRVGINMAALLETAQACIKAQYPEAREQSVRYIVMQMDSYLRRQKRANSSDVGRSFCSRMKMVLAQNCCIFWAASYGNHLCFIYLCSKALYFTNAVGQLFLLDSFLGMSDEYFMYGLAMMKTAVDEGNWGLQSDRFPRVTLCDFQVRQQTNVHRYTVQCVLPINLFNEKIFLFIWFWLLLIALTTVCSLIQWFSRTVVLSMQVSYVQRQLRAIDRERRDWKSLRRFTDFYLRRDGLVIVQLISASAGEMLAAEVLHGLWQSSGTEKRSYTFAREYTGTFQQNNGGPAKGKKRFGNRWASAVKKIFSRKKNDRIEKPGVSRADSIGDKYECDVV